ncbi:MAG: type VI secretion system contractile sheath large subunit, partial [bacterium]|nr:type VI secretion system contractile sheath large subunit [bacterium]
MAEEKAVDQVQETVEEEKSVLDSLFEKVEMAPPKEGEAETPEAKFSHALNLLIHAVSDSEEAVEKVDKVLVDSVIAEIDKKISAQVNEVMHNAEFQKLESAWRGLRFLVDRTNFRRNIKLEILNVSKDELRNDFEEVPETIQAGLFKHIYEQEYDQAGGEPIGGIIGNYEFENTVQDLALLRNLSKVAAASHAPFIGSVGPKFFGAKSVEELPLLPDIAPIFEKTEYMAWRGFRESEDSRYVGLTLPRFLLRTPYGPETVPAKSFHFEEEAGGESHDKYLWGNASFAFAATLTRSFSDNGWCVNI